MNETIDMTPTPEGFAGIAQTFAESILGDVRVNRRQDSQVLLDGLIEIVAYLAQVDPRLVRKLRSSITGDGR